MLLFVVVTANCYTRITCTPLECHPRPPETNAQSGVALPLTIVIIALATTIVVSVTYSTYMSGRLNASLEQGLRGEYYVKSALNLARVLIRADITDEDSPKDPWYIFKSGLTIPTELLGIEEKNVKVDLEISPLGAKIPLRCLVPTTNSPPAPQWLDAFKRLFDSLGFNDDEEVDQTGRFENRVFKPNEMVANLVDYMDRDSTSLDVSNYPGVESDLPNGVFKNTDVSRETELASIPGFTPARLQKLLKYVSVAPGCTVNINSAPAEVLNALHFEITPSQIDEIKKFRTSESGPFREVSQLEQYLSQASFQAIRPYLEVRSSRFVVIAKAEFLANVTFLKAGLDTQRERGSLPRITSLELF